ncbi:exo-beta-N-acetylmuramidase NamZ family protein [Carboxylicivirga sp. RSCT41]|uniref:exo-beta-N-acetylmuramidase NamZ family protein n=1 Tax=Carboxylicivirga agarovorans TaxID=3417570 RepID=UPI003D348769
MLKLGCEQVEEYLPLLKDKRVGLLVNHTSVVNGVHIVDTLLAQNIKITKIFAPEHGFRGKADAGEHIDSNVDVETGIPVISLYGKHKKPTEEDLSGLDIVIFDIQDVGVRFYTYISSMHYMMEACAEQGVPMVVFDRPNPNGDYFDGPILKDKFKSFVGMHPIPVVHGLTVGELAKMINGEKWLKDSLQCDLSIIEMDNYNHNMMYSLPIKPSPNLPNDISIRLYPSLCFFEATEVSVGRGTYMPFQIIGYPDSTFGEFTFTPVSIDGMSKYPPQQDKLCYGVDLRSESLSHRFSLEYLLDFYEKSSYSDDFISNERWFNLLAGTDELFKQVKAGLTEEQIRQTWQDELNEYSRLRDHYLIYP